MIFIRTFGCGKNYFESQEASFRLSERGFRVYAQPMGSDRDFVRAPDEISILKKAEYVIVNTCTISEDSERECQLGFIKSTLEINPEVKVLLTGCSIRNKFSAINHGLPFKASLFNDLAGIISFLELQPKRKYRQSDIHPLIMNKAARFFVLLKDYCDRYCSFCACPIVRRKRKLSSLRDILRQISLCQELGYGSIDLAGPCIGDWFDAENKKFRFADLLRLVLDSTRLQIGFLELHPLDINGKVLEMLCHPRINKDEISIPIQSASDRILRLMKRGYDLKYLKRLFKKLYKLLPGAGVSTDIIVGLPFQSDRDILNTMSFLEEYPFLRIDVYPYSLRKGTILCGSGKALSSEIYSRHYRLISGSTTLKRKLNFLFPPQGVIRLRQAMHYSGIKSC